MRRKRKKRPIESEIDAMELKLEAAELAGGEMTTWEAEDAPPEVIEAFWKQVVEFEKAPWTTHFELLERGGMVLSSPDDLDDTRVSHVLWDVIRKLETMRIYLTSTDHLSDRELYERLWNDALREDVKDMMIGSDAAWHIDLIGSGSDEDTEMYLRYYADDETRSRWKEDFPDYRLPPHEDPPYNRDRHLPRPSYEPPPIEDDEEDDWWKREGAK